MRATPSPRAEMSPSRNSHWNVTLRRPSGSVPRGSIRTGAAVPDNGSTRGGRHAAIPASASVKTLANRNDDNTISLDDAIEDVFASQKCSEHRVTAIEMRLRRVCDEELAAAGIRT